MYELHADIDTPSDDTVIWRYMDLERLLALLSNSSLYLCRLDRLRDPWEGLWPKSVLDRMRLQLASQVSGGLDSFVGFFKDLPKSFFVSCWHENTTESAAFWDQYGNSRGLAIRSSIGRLKECSRSEMTFFIGLVKYLDYDHPEPIERSFNALSPAFLKRRSFEHEREVRVLQWHLPFTKDKVDWSSAIDSAELPIDLKVLIESVYISPMSPVWLVDAVHQLLSRFGMPVVPVRRSELYDRTIA